MADHVCDSNGDMAMKREGNEDTASYNRVFQGGMAGKDPKRPKAVFNMDANFFRQVGGEYYERYFKPATVVQFKVVLPFHVAIPDGLLGLVNDEEIPRNVVLCLFETIVVPKQYVLGVPGHGPELPENRTQVEITYLTPDSNDDNHFDDDFLSGIFDACISSLNTVLVAYLLKTQDIEVYRVSIPMLPSVVPARAVPMSDWFGGSPTFLHLLHVNLPVEKEPQPPKGVAEIARHVWVLEGKRNPFALSQELILNARRHNRNGFYQEAVAFANLSVEVFLRSLHVELQCEVEGRSKSDAEALTEATAFIKLVKSVFHPILGGKWNVEDCSTKVGGWYTNTYQLRNRIIHDGYFPKSWEAALAIDAAWELRAYVVGLLRSKKKKLPRTWLYFAK